MHAARLLLAAFLASSSFALGQVSTTVVDIPAASGGTQRFLYIRPANVTATLVSIPGGTGMLGIQNDGTMSTQTGVCNPYGRVRDAFAAQGIAMAFVDATSAGSIYNFADIQEVVRYMRARHAVPVWITGGSASTAAATSTANNLPAGDPVGLVLFAPSQITAQAGAAVRRPTLVISHQLDTGIFPASVFNSLVNAPVRERVTIAGGTNAGCGYHLFNGSEAAFAEAVTGFIARNNASLQPEPNYQALWYAAPAESEPGWGVNVAHQGDTLFATWFTYDADGPMWLVMSNGVKLSDGLYRGTLFRTTGPAFSAVPFDRTRVGVTEVGTATFDFTDAGNVLFSYTVSGVSGSKRITRQAFGPLPTCTAAGAPSASNFQDLWWASPPESESGWGLNVTHQGDILFATWFTYAASGKGRWLVMPALARQAGGGFRYSGDILETSGAPFNAYDPARFSYSVVGTATLEFTAESAGAFSYMLDGVTQSKPITRQVFGAPITRCQ